VIGRSPEQSSREIASPLARAPAGVHRRAAAARSLVVAVLALAASSARGEEPALVDVAERIPDAVLDLRYATPDNFLERKVYPDGARCLLHPLAAARLEQAARTLREMGFRIRLYDCFRPRSVQWEMWRILPRPGYVADPRKGSNHNRGVAVDLTLADREGREVEMPTRFDTFTRAAHHRYSGASTAAKRHRQILLRAMESAGFKRNAMEWWHYDLAGAGKHPVLEAPLAAVTPSDAGTR
jgi:D-alanyl-D-alanine dipeptidase